MTNEQYLVDGLAQVGAVQVSGVPGDGVPASNTDQAIWMIGQ